MNAEISSQFSKKICPECGQPIDEKTETYLIECDHCLSKKDNE